MFDAARAALLAAGHEVKIKPTGEAASAWMSRQARYAGRRGPTEEKIMASVALEKLRNRALELSEAERAELAHDLVASLDDKPDPGAADAWDDEILRRVEEIDQGTAALVDALRSRQADSGTGARQLMHRI